MPQTYWLNIVVTNNHIVNECIGNKMLGTIASNLRHVSGNHEGYMYRRIL